jgi:hypothetical protein
MRHEGSGISLEPDGGGTDAGFVFPLHKVREVLNID